MSIISEISAGLVWCKVGGSAYMDRDDPLGVICPPVNSPGIARVKPKKI